MVYGKNLTIAYNDDFHLLCLKASHVSSIKFIALAAHFMKKLIRENKKYA